MRHSQMLGRLGAARECFLSRSSSLSFSRFLVFWAFSSRQKRHTGSNPRENRRHLSSRSSNNGFADFRSHYAHVSLQLRHASVLALLFFHPPVREHIHLLVMKSTLKQKTNDNEAQIAASGLQTQLHINLQHHQFFHHYFQAYNLHIHHRIRKLCLQQLPHLQYDIIGGFHWQHTVALLVELTNLRLSRMPVGSEDNTTNMKFDNGLSIMRPTAAACISRR